MTAHRTPGPGAAAPALHATLLAWYAECGRDLPWRRPDAAPWGIFVSEIMLQQTPVARVEPAWRQWLERWPAPADLAAAAPGDAIHAWGRLGYPRRALRLHQAAVEMMDRHGGAVPGTLDGLAALPGVGGYTSAAVAAFAFGLRATVLDTNVRRVLARVLTGVALPAPTLRRGETDLAAAVLPTDAATSATWNVAVMELGALICAARAPRCRQCPVAGRCAWRLGGFPAYDGPPRRGQGYAGTDRYVRGLVLQTLRTSKEAVPRGALSAAEVPAHQIDRCLDSLVFDGLVEPLAGAGEGHYRLPGTTVGLRQPTGDGKGA